MVPMKDLENAQETSISISSELYKLFENKIFKIALPQSLDLYQEYISLYSEQKSDRRRQPFLDVYIRLTLQLLSLPFFLQ